MKHVQKFDEFRGYMKTRRNFIKDTVLGGISGIILSGTAPVYAKERVSKKAGVSLDDAMEIHKKSLIFDGHNDNAVERIDRGENPLRWKDRDEAYNIDIPRMKEGGYSAGIFNVGDSPDSSNVWITTECILDQTEAYPDDLKNVRTSKDVLNAKSKGKIGILLGVESVQYWLDGKVDTLDTLYRLGIRLIGITHKEGGSDPKFLQGSQSIAKKCSVEDRENDRKNAGGLTPLGLEVVKRCNELGMVIDLSHINDKAFYDVLEHSTLPPVMSHTAVFSICNHARCMTDDQIKSLAAKDGVMGIAFAPQFIDPDVSKATIDRVVDHICYVGDLVGIDYVGIGTDFDGLGTYHKPVVPDVSQLPLLTRSMLARGMSEEEIRKVWGGNFMRVLKKTIDI